MSEMLLSLGLDVGTTSTQMILSELTVENRASGFSVPELEITNRKIRYKSPIHFTPLLEEARMDAEALREIVTEEYRKAGITREQVDTGALIITGETSRKENAKAVLSALSDFAGDFVVAAAGPDLESVLAAKGAGAVAYSEKTGKTVLHMDIGGGTSNLCLIENGKILDTGCLNVGGRLVKITADGTVTYVSPVLKGLCSLKPGDRATQSQLAELAQLLTHALEMAAGLRDAEHLLEQLTTAETGRLWHPPQREVTLSFSGGVADCIEKELPWLSFGDLGPLLGQAIHSSALCQGDYILGAETIRATVIGAGCHSAQLSGSTVFCQNVRFPLKNLPVVTVTEEPGQAQKRQEGPAILALPQVPCQSYSQITKLAQTIADTCKPPIYLSMEQDMAKALGQALALRLPENAQILCLDRVKAGDGSYLDIGQQVGSAFPVVIKTLVLGSA